jgi:hypothetical protein
MKLWICWTVSLVKQELNCGILSLSCCSHFEAQGIRQKLCFTLVSSSWESVGPLGRGNQPIARPLPTQDNTKRIKADKHPCLEWDSNPRSYRSSERRQFTARPLWPVIVALLRQYPVLSINSSTCKMHFKNSYHWKPRIGEHLSWRILQHEEFHNLFSSKWTMEWKAFVHYILDIHDCGYLWLSSLPTDKCRDNPSN